MNEHEHEKALGKKLQERLSNYLGEAHSKLIPPGTLGGGMGFRTRQSGHSIVYDEAKGELTVQATFKITIYQHEPADDAP